MSEMSSIEAQEKIKELRKELSEIDEVISSKEKEIRESMRNKIETMKKGFESKRAKLQRQIGDLEKILIKANEKATLEIARLAESNPEMFSNLSAETVKYLKGLAEENEAKF